MSPVGNSLGFWQNTGLSMVTKYRLLVLMVSLVGALALAQPLWLMAQTAEPPALPTPTLAAAPATATPDPSAPPIPRVHEVQDGENMTLIAANYGVSVEEILAINNLPNGDLLQVGQELIIPGGTGEAIATVHTIGPGDTLSDIAAGFNTTAADLIATNRLIRRDLPLIVGQTVPVVSRNGSSTARPVTGRPYLARSGDTLLLVAARHNLSPQTLAEINGLPANAYLFAGQRLRLPDESAIYRDLPEGWLDVRFNALPLAQGSSLSIYVENMLPGTPAGRFGDVPLHFAPYQEGYVALVGIDAFAEPGIYEVELTGGDERGLWSPILVRVPVAETPFDTQYVEVGEALDGLLDPTIRASEDAFLEGIYNEFTDTPHWSGVFTTPLTTTVVSAGYGGRRSYNNGPIEIYHTGVDYAAATGETVIAPAAGVVVYSNILELRGGTIIIDHGLGVMTGYYHLSEKLVLKGDTVTAGQPIGRVGSTGLSSGPHLHWDLRILNVPVDATLWTQRQFP